MQVRLAAPAVWKPLVEQPNTKEHQAAGRAILMTLHRRHVGITPDLALELAQTLNDVTKRPASNTAWGSVFERLTKTLIGGDKQTGAQRETLTALYRFGLLLAASPSYVVLRLALPLVVLACRVLDEMILFCGDEVGADVSATAYSEYAGRLSRQIIALAKSDDYEMFWRECALTLSTFYRREGSTHPGEDGLPELDPRGLGILTRLAPELRSGRQTPRLLRRPSAVKQFTSRREREGGFDGIRISHHLEEIDDMLFSELLNDKATRTDRLLNTGYFVFERQPKQVKLRDVLVICWLPETPTRDPRSGGFWRDLVKACWFEVSARFGVVLLQNNLHLSEFRWIEGDSLARSRQAAFVLTDLPIAAHAVYGRLTPEFRDTFLNALRWMPDFLNDRDFDQVERRPRSRASSPTPASTPADPEPLHSGLGALAGDTWEAALLRWTADVWRSQLDADAWRAREHSKEGRRETALIPSHTRPTRRLAVEQFAVIHHLFVLPESRYASATQEHTVGHLLTQLCTKLADGRSSQMGASILWAPHDLDRGQWIFSMQERSQPATYVPPEEGHTAGRVAGWVVDNWLDHLIDEVRRG